VDIFLSITPTRDSILPPLSSRVVKYLINSGSLFQDLRGLSSSRDHYKPLFISCLYDERGRRLYSIYHRREVLSVRAGSRLTSRVSAYIPKDHLENIISFSDGIYSTPYGEFRVSLDRVEVIGDLRSLSIDLSKGFRIVFITPTLISPKIMIPPLRKIMDRYKSARVGYATFPIPGLIYSYALRLWNKVAPEDLMLTRPNDRDDIYSYRIAVMGTALTEIIDHRINVKTVIIGRDDKERMRKSRGFVGYIILNTHHKSSRKAMEKALALAKHLGIGRGRGIGLGEVDITPKHPVLQ